jgi:hypothetical protein
VRGVRPVLVVRVGAVGHVAEPSADMDHHQQRLDAGDRPDQGRAPAQIRGHHGKGRANHRDRAPELQILSILHGHRHLSPT